jgi:hypothetical protein
MSHLILELIIVKILLIVVVMENGQKLNNKSESPTMFYKMFIFFTNLPLELNLIILDYSNFFQEQHKIKYTKVLNYIRRQVPKFMYEISQLYRGIFKITYYCFEKDNKQILIMKN